MISHNAASTNRSACGRSGALRLHEDNVIAAGKRTDRYVDVHETTSKFERVAIARCELDATRPPASRCAARRNVGIPIDERRKLVGSQERSDATRSVRSISWRTLNAPQYIYARWKAAAFAMLYRSRPFFASGWQLAHRPIRTVFLRSVTAPVRARSRPRTVTPVPSEMEACAKIVPTNTDDVFSVAELPTCQNTLQRLAPLIKVTELYVAATSVDGIWKINTLFRLC